MQLQNVIRNDDHNLIQMKKRHTLVLSVILLSACAKPKDRVCQCTDIGGTIVIDTAFYATSDEAYQACEGLEFNSGIENCQAYE